MTISDVLLNNSSINKLLTSAVWVNKNELLRLAVSLKLGTHGPMLLKPDYLIGWIS